MYLEIIPNWHPIFVHFNIALWTSSAIFYLANLFTRNKGLLIAAQWNLWVGTIFTVITLFAGLYASNTVPHNAVSHQAMMNHRNWAFVTLGIFSILSLLSLMKRGGVKIPDFLFVLMMLLACGFLIVTGHKGAKLVYHHGIGVQDTSIYNVEQSKDHDALNHIGHRH